MRKGKNAGALFPNLSNSTSTEKGVEDEKSLVNNIRDPSSFSKRRLAQPNGMTVERERGRGRIATVVGIRIANDEEK